MIEATTHPSPHRGAWSRRSKNVQAAVRFIRAKGALTPEQMVEWDDRHGRRLFTWDEGAAAEQWRVHEARLFFNTFRVRLNGYRVRMLVSIPENIEGGRDGRAYHLTEDIAEVPNLRAIVVEALMGEIASKVAELKMWKLTKAERGRLFERVRRSLA